MVVKTFRNTLIASSVLFGASLIAGSAAMAAPATDDGTVTATVAEINAISFEGATTAFVSGSAVPAFAMGTLDVRNNASAGWTLGMSSANGGRLINTATPAHVITYTALTTGDIGASTATAVTPTVATPSGQLHNSAFDAAVSAGVTGVNVTASIAAGQFVPVGSYTDTLTFTLTSK
ncbi:hypothetical protein [Leptolyngbya sp. KIOST-1]|uniref:hypothetical protein n=1 Tax=Leptolyngbya sp. KIOST-1 TaxID=1229172 RepID=UPI0012E03AA8|nr:hypothetical protein [Leptolyngbya sp. KIOST-1]